MIGKLIRKMSVPDLYILAELETDDKNSKV